jgi:hypothetical protein
MFYKILPPTMKKISSVFFGIEVNNDEEYLSYFLQSFPVMSISVGYLLRK